MSIEKDYTVCYQPIYAGYGGLEMRANNGKVLVEGNTLFSQGDLSDEFNFTFTVDASAPGKIRKFEIKNIHATLMAAEGNFYRMEIPSLMRHPLTFLDSQAGQTNYIEHVNGLSANNYKVTVKRSSSDLPYPLKLDPIYGYVPDTEAYLINPAFGFTIVYYYY